MLYFAMPTHPWDDGLRMGIEMELELASHGRWLVLVSGLWPLPAVARNAHVAHPSTHCEHPGFLVQLIPVDGTNYSCGLPWR